MKKYLLALMLALSSLSAFAQTTCLAPGTKFQTITKPTPACLPQPMKGATGTFSDFYYNASGVVLAHYCPTAYEWRADYSVATWDWIKTNGIDAFKKAAEAGDLAKVQTLTKAATSLPLEDPSMQAVWCPHYSKIIAKIPVMFAVAKNGSYTTRPMYAMMKSTDMNGVTTYSVGNKSSATATVGAACNCGTVRAVLSGYNYCPATSDSALGALCTKK